MIAVQTLVLVLVAFVGTAVVFTRDPVRQTIVLSFYGLVLAVIFFVYQAPDVALSQITVGTIALPVLILLALSKVQGGED